MQVFSFNPPRYTANNMNADSVRDHTLRVLYVDDDEEDFILTSSLLSESETFRYRMKWGKSFAHAKELLSEDSFDLLLFDNNLQGESGINLIRWCKSQLIHAPVIILTGQNDAETDLAAMEAGASDFLVKGEITFGLIERSFRYAINRARVERRLTKNREKYQRLIEQIPDAILTLDSEGVVEYASPPVFDVTGYTVDQVVGCKLNEKILAEDVDKFATYAEDSKWSRHFEIRLADPAGKTRWIRFNPRPFVDGEKIVRIQCVLTNISMQKDLEVQLLQAQKLESIGQLAAGIAHEINTPCQFVSDNLSFIRESLCELDNLFDRLSSGELNLPETLVSLLKNMDLKFLREELPLSVKQSQEGISRVSKIVKAMKEFSHPGNNVKKNSSINDAIKTTCTVAKNEWKYVADLTTEFDEELPLVPILCDEFNQVILNLITNAAHAIGDMLNGSGEKGSIHIKTFQQDRWVGIRITDSGPGIPVEIQQKVFDPFFTTKEVGKGTGQGLTISRNVIVEKHGGQLTLASEQGMGTTFQILVPREETKDDA